MGPSTMRIALAGATATALSGVLFKSANLSKQPMDYLQEADPAFSALIGGDVAGFAERCPAYCGTLVLRAPFVLAAAPGGSTSMERYTLAMVPCLIATLIFALMTWRRATPRAGWLVILLVAFNPIVFNAYRSGHGEELLVGVFCVAAMLAAGAQRPKLAGALLGLAVGGKPWAVVAILPVLLTLRTNRAQAAGIGALACALVMVPTLLHATAGGENPTLAVAQSTGGFARPGEIWWFLGTVNPNAETEGWRVPPAWVNEWSHPMVVIGAVLVALAAWWRERGFSTERGLLLLAAVLLVRCMLDTWNVAYYAAPFVFALLAWEVRARPGLPWRTLLASLAAWITLVKLMRSPEPDVQSLLYLMWSVPFLACLVTRLLGYEGRLFSLPAAARSRQLAPSVHGANA